MKETTMKIPSYILTEVIRRLERGDAESEARGLIEAMGLPLEDPGPDPDIDALSESYEGATMVDSFRLDGTLEILSERTPIHFRVCYAIPLDEHRPADMMFGPTISIDLLTWSEFDPNEASWTPMAPNILSDAMLAKVRSLISRHAQVKR